MNDKIILEEICKDLSKRERIFVKLHRKLVIKIFNIIRINTVNYIIEKSMQ